MQITKELLKKWKACKSSYEWFLEKFPQSGSFSEISSALKLEKHYDDDSWLTKKVFESAFKSPDQIKSIVDDQVKIALKEVEGSPNSSSGDYSKAASSGYGSTAASSGYSSKAASSGDCSTASALGLKTIAMVAGLHGKAKAGEQGAFALAWKDNNDQIRIAVGLVGENGIKADTAYFVDGNGNLKEVTE